MVVRHDVRGRDLVTVDVQPLRRHLQVDATDAVPFGFDEGQGAGARVPAEHGDGDPLEPDIAFHVAVLHASRNRFYAQLAGFTATALRISIRMTNRYKGVRLASVADHKKVADAIIAGRPAAAGEAMRKLIQEALDLITKREAQQVARRLPVNANR